ncbi:hypothetical protein, partial [Pseudomonas sp. Sample_23]|uniref:hypothetical protein n=1 Tax=Pseudomonas sp. Sample_23 TaxID=2448267 RepID=UPI0019D512E5
FAGGGERVKKQCVGAAHDQEVGLSYVAEVEWLRGCKADSRLAVVLKVGFYLGAVEGEAVACRVRNYGVRAGLDDLTTFDYYDWNHWASKVSAWSKIVLVGEYFVETIPRGSPANHGIAIDKSYQKIDTGAALEFSFDYRAWDTKVVTFLQNGQQMLGEELAASELWQSRTVRFNVAKSLTMGSLHLSFTLAGYGKLAHLKNLRLRAI